MSWTDGPLLGFDTETTGVDVTHDRIVTAAVVRRDATGTSVRTWLLDPGVEIPSAATAIHGITTAHARAHGASPSVALEEIADALTAALAAGTPVVAFNASFDLSLLDAELRRHGLRSLVDRLGASVSPVIDPLVLDRSEARYRRGKRTLADLCGVYRVADTGSLHTADVDVVATLDVLSAIADAYPHLRELTPTALHAYQVVAHRAWAEEFNAWRVTRGMTGPGAELTWPGRDAASSSGALPDVAALPA
ncbi:MAG TPA: exonuclease domain-containing protein [Cellulomonadaceae bacterium]|nr:exonuclease domain-containing protein [Cellulomonadaceae bacterium]